MLDCVQRSKGELVQSMDSHPTLTLVLSLWAGVGPLVGLLLGHYLIRSWQRMQWLLDSRKQEFRELMSALSDTIVHLMMFTPALEEGHAEKEFAEFVAAQKVTMRVLADRIYIARDLRELNTSDRFLNATQGARQSNIAERGKMLADIMGELVLRANNG
jgi:hypothetical protein